MIKGNTINGSGKVCSTIIDCKLALTLSVKEFETEDPSTSLTDVNTKTQAKKRSLIINTTQELL